MTHAQRRVPIGTGLDHEGTASVEVAARWLALEPSPPRPVVPALKERFGLTALQACEATALAFDLRAGGGAA
nr:hypothetical protein [Rhizobium herbae]